MVNLFQPVFHEDAASLVVSQDDFNLVEDKVDVKAVKMDDAKVPVHIWNSRLIRNYPIPDTLNGISDTKINSTLEVIRNWMILVWFRRIQSSFTKYMQIAWKDEYFDFIHSGK